jgi:membrane protease YdiL (CAAX protease family)
MEVAAPEPQWPAWVEIILASGFPTQLTIGFGLRAAGVTAFRPDGSLSATFAFALTLIDTVLLLSLIVWMIVRRGQSPRQIFLGDRSPAGEAALGLVSAPLVIAMVAMIAIVIRAFVPQLRNVPDNPLEGLLGTQTGLLTFLFVAIVAGGVREELQRAFLLTRFRDDLGQPWMGVFITSLAFGMGHTLQGYDAAIITGSLGAVWGVIYIVRRSAIGPIVSHSLFNSVELVRVFFR